MLLLGFSPTAFTWGPDGHAIIADIAERRLDDQSRLWIRDILGEESLAYAANWPDVMRSNPNTFWQKTSKPWHYVTVPDGSSYAQVGAPPQGDALTALARFRKTLLDTSSSREQKALAFRFSLHIIADLHQPMHVGNGKDRGGNKVKLSFDGKRSNLHSLWDSGLIRFYERRSPGWSQDVKTQISDGHVSAWQSIHPLDWVTESQELRGRVYPTSRSPDTNYANRQETAVRWRLQQAGLRSAAWINELLRSPGAQEPQPGYDALESDE